MRAQGRYSPVPTSCDCSPAEHKAYHSSARMWNSLRPIGVAALDEKAGWFGDMRNCPNNGTLTRDIPPEAVEKHGSKWHVKPSWRWTEANFNYTFEE